MTLRDTLLRCAEDHLFEPHWSPNILEELSRNLVRDGDIGQRRADRLIAQMTRAFPRALVEPAQDRVSQMTNHPKDRHVLAAAVHAGVTTIVTSDRRHFPAAALDPYQVTAQSPDAFLCDLTRTDPFSMVGVIRQQADDLVAPPLSVGDVLVGLERIVPNFATLMRRAILLDSR